MHSNKDIIGVIVNIILHFKWRWIAFLNSDNDFGEDSLELFKKSIMDTEICLAYTEKLNHNTNYSLIFKRIEEWGVHIIVVFAPELTSIELIDSAIELNITKKVWIAGDTWSLNKRLQQKKGIKNIGTVLGVSQPVVTIPGFNDFIFSSRSQTQCENAEQQTFCNQVYNCSTLSEEVSTLDPSFSFAVYSAVYAIAHALHNVLKCGAGRCNDNITVYPYMVSIHIMR